MKRCLLALVVVLAALSTPTVSLSAAKHATQAGPGINLLCLGWGSSYSGGLSCIPDNGRYRPARAHVSTLPGSTHNWTIVRASIPGAHPLLCARLYNRGHGKGGYYGSSGLSCFPENQHFSVPGGQFTINGTHAKTGGGDWWLNNLSIDGQLDHTCLSWDSSGAGVYCFTHDQGVFDESSVSVHGWMTSSDNWWVNRVEAGGMKTQVCITWDSTDSGGVSCFPQEGFYDGSPQLTLAQRINDRWGVDVLQIPGQRKRVCLVWDGLGATGGGMSCVAHGGNPLVSQTTVHTVHLDHGYELDRVHIPVG